MRFRKKNSVSVKINTVSAVQNTVSADLYMVFAIENNVSAVLTLGFAVHCEVFNRFRRSERVGWPWVSVWRHLAAFPLEFRTGSRATVVRLNGVTRFSIFIEAAEKGRIQ